MDNETKEINLNSDQYRRFLMKLLNEDQDNLPQKLAQTDDVIKAYFFQPSTNDFIEAELDTSNKTIKAENNTYLIYDKFINNDVKLLHTELQSIQMFNEIEDQVKDLRDNHNIEYNIDIYADIVKKFDNPNLLYSVSSGDIQGLNKELQHTNEALMKIDTLLEHIQNYRDTYNMKENIMNIEVITNAFEQNTKVDIYFDSWTEMKSLYERQSDFQKTALKIGVEDFLKDKNSIFKEIDLNIEKIGVAEYISKTKVEELSDNRMIPQVFGANENSVAEKMRNNMLVHNHLEYMEYSLKRMELYNPSIAYSHSKLEEYIDLNKDRALSNVMHHVNQEMKDIYGENFHLFDENDSNATRNKLFEKLIPVVNNDTFSLYELQKIEPITKKDYEIRDFWESKNLNMLTDYKNEKNIYFEANMNDMYFQSKNLEKAINNLPEIMEESNDINNRQLGRIKEAIEDTKDSLYQIKLALATDIDKIKIDPDKKLNHDDRTQHNSLMNNLLTVNNLESKMEQFEGYIDILENKKVQEKEKENHKEMEMER